MDYDILQEYAGYDAIERMRPSIRTLYRALTGVRLS